MLSGLSFREQSNFEHFARVLVRLPDPGEDPMAYLLPKARWRELTQRVPDEAAWLMALSQATGVYFFPSREWVRTLMLYLGPTRGDPASGGRGRPGLSHCGPGPQLRRWGHGFPAVDTGDGEFVSGLPVYAGVERADALSAAP